MYTVRTVKRCSVCKQHLPLERFNVRRASRDGRAYRCADCNKEYQRRWRAEKPNAFREWHQRNLDRRRAYFREWSAKNAERRASELAMWTRANRDRRRQKDANRNAAKLRASVKWANEEAIRAIYAEAVRLTAETGVRYEVDHYYPLQGELVCGLHCEANLQILTKTENIRKKNRMPEEFDFGAVA
jgi:hypothetical protein